MNLIIFFAAICPAAILMYVVYKADKIEKEPAGLLVKLFLFGLLSTVSALILEIIGQFVLGFLFYPNSILYNVCLYFLVVALSEEAGKYVVVKKVAWKDPAFNYTFDGVVYAVFSSLGFAALENLMYLSDWSWITAIMRGILSVPGHAIDAVFMGSYFGAAKRCEAIGDEKGKKANLFKALAVPVLVHGFYDFCLSIEDIFPYAIFIFFAFEIFITIYAIKKVKKLSATDSAIFPMGYYPGATAAYQMYTQGTIAFDPMTGMPVYTAPVQPAMGFDPMTGMPMMQPQPAFQPAFNQMGAMPVMQAQPQYQQPVQPQYQQGGFDPMTGQPVMQAQPQYQQPVQPQYQQGGFDPMTGQPVMQAQPQFQQPVQPVVEQPVVQAQPVVEQPAVQTQPAIQPVVEEPAPAALNFDPMTGQPIVHAQPASEPENATQELAPNVVSSANYDPMTGRPVSPVFNPEV